MKKTKTQVTQFKFNKIDYVSILNLKHILTGNSIYQLISVNILRKEYFQITQTKVFKYL